MQHMHTRAPVHIVIGSWYKTIVGLSDYGGRDVMMSARAKLQGTVEQPVQDAVLQLLSLLLRLPVGAGHGRQKAGLSSCEAHLRIH